MRINRHLSRNSVYGAGIALALLAGQGSPCWAQSSAFTYQGHLNDGPNTANGSYDLRFALYDAATGGSRQGNPLTNAATRVSGSLFQVTLDFGPGAFPGGPRWLEVAVHTNGFGEFVALAPRQALTAAPYALYGMTPADPQGPPGPAGSADAWSRAGNASTTPGVNFLGTTDFQPLELKVKGVRGLRLEPVVGDLNSAVEVNLLGGSQFNFITPGTYGSVIAGGGHGADYYHVAYSNSVSANLSFLGSGAGNSIAAIYSVLGGGWNNVIEGSADESVLGGGDQNAIHIYADHSFLGGGERNSIQSFSEYSFIGGGKGNTVGSWYAVVPGGSANEAQGLLTFAAGYRAKAFHNGSFVWADSQNADFASTATNQFLIRAQGGVGINVAPSWPLDVQAPQAVGRFTTTSSCYGSVIELQNTLGSAGYLGAINFNNGAGTYPGQIVYATSGTLSFRVGGVDNSMLLNSSGLSVRGTFVSSSDRNEKEHFQPVSPQEVLEKVAALPISRWNYKFAPGDEHIGPMAQDFYAAFQAGADDKHIATVDADGVALAAIQGLNQKVEEQRLELQAKQAQLKAQQAQIDSLAHRLAALEQSVGHRP